MKKFLLILLFFHLSSSGSVEKHSLRFFCAGFSGIPNFPDFVRTMEVDEIQALYYDSKKRFEPKQEWVETLMQTDPDHVDWYKDRCFEIQPNRFKAWINSFMKSFKQTEGVHILQMISGCEWDDETGEVDGFLKYGYDGEDFISFDVNTLTWIALKPEAVPTKLSWNADISRIHFNKQQFLKVYPGRLKKYVDIAKSSLMRKVVPSVSLLQKSPSSPVTCHATGFFPDRAVMFWRRDGEELQEDVDHGEILPNHDGTFQMSVDLLKPPAEDWRSYECVFQLSGVKEDIISKLHKDVIRTNHEDPTDAAVGVGVSLLLLLLLVAAGVGFVFYRQRKDTKTRTESPETLNPETTSMNPPSCSEPDQDQEEESLNTEPVS
ncbi:major histocompatibility complex class I-related protein 1-like [Halichoeres trimaculatus]|uniref:major histocompatibility complex class I-related protein 1-like n=1 Tax=Halichoeres trimaculatus TaxID=147232 RepID=UPI003D9F01B1